MVVSKLILGDCLLKMKELLDNSVDLVCTDPPYALNFMNKEFDSQWQTPKDYEVWTKKWATEALRVLKSGGFLLSFGAPRTFHRMACGFEDAGFIINNCIMHGFATGFPKSQSISDMIAKREGAKREGAKREGVRNTEGIIAGEMGFKSEYTEYSQTENSKEWEGWGTANLKPAYEPIIVAQKPCEKSVVDNVMKHGVGGFNIDATRLPYSSNENPQDLLGGRPKCDRGEGYGYDALEEEAQVNENGRFPANLIVENDVLNNGEKPSQGHWANSKVSGYGNFGGGEQEYYGVGEKDKPDSFSRYFSLNSWWENKIKNLPREAQKTFPVLLCPKAPKSERNIGFKNSTGSNTYNKKCLKCEKWQRKGQGLSDEYTCHCEEPEWEDPKGNYHPTLKPIKILSWLISLSTKENYTVLDPFMGSGTTGIASYYTNRNFIGIEKEEDYYKIAEARIKKVREQTKLE